MEYSHSPIALSAGLSSVSLNFGERSLSSLTTELGEAARLRMQQQQQQQQQQQGHPMSPGASGMMSPSSNPLKQCRSSSDMDIDLRDDRRGPMKLARTDSFNNSQHSDLKMQMSGSGTLGSLVRSNSMVSDGRLGCSPTNSTASDGALLGNESSLMSEQRLTRNDSLVSCPQGYGAAAANSRPMYHHQAYSLRPSGLPLSMSREIVSNMGMHDADRGPQALFTNNQLRELQHQALVLKYIMSGVNVPAELLNPIRSSVVGLSAIPTGSHHLTNMAWGNYHLGFASNTDPEPGRCRRTDGKKWRCSRDVVPEQKYCERHMHRGRHRSRKPAETQTSSSQAMSVAAGSSSSGASSVSLGAARGSTPPSGLRPSVTVNTQQNRPASNLGIKSYSGANSPNGSGGISVGSSMNGSQFQMPLQSAGTPGLSAKDFRYLNGITKTELDLGPEQMFFAEATGSTRGIGQDMHTMNGLSMLSSVNNSWRSMASKAPSAPQPKANSSSLLHYNSPQLRSLLGQDFGLMSDANSVNMSMAQQQHSFLGSGFGAVDQSVSVGREPEGQPLRHFFDDWPRSRDPSTLSWSDVDDERSNRNSSTTQLSISIPMASSDFTSTNASSPRGKLSLSPLKLSMSRAGDDDPLGVDATQMGLGVGMGLGVNEDRHRQTNWIPIAWETPVGGPLAEVLQSSTPRGCKSSGLNLMTDGWESSPRDSPRLASPTDREGAGRVPGSGVGALEASKAMD